MRIPGPVPNVHFRQHITGLTMKKKPGLQKAIQFINTQIASGEFTRQFPSIQLLAKAADVSFVTMWRAVDQLRKNGVLVQVGKKGRYTPADQAGQAPDGTIAGPACQSVECSVPLWEKVMSQLRKDILTGRYSFGVPLPSIKDLRNSYSISFPTLKKSLDRLWAEGILVTHRRGYAVPPFSKSKSSVRIAAIGCGWEDGTLWVDYQDKNYFRILEAECIKLKISLDIVVYYEKNNKLYFIDSISRKPYDFSDHNLLSAMFIVANLEISPEEVLRHLVQFKKPVAVLDVVGGWDLSSRTSGSNYVQLFTATTSHVPPREVGRFLLSLGHTTVAFISPFHKARWSKQRYADVRQVYTDAGFPGKVLPFVFDQFCYQWNYLQEGYENVNDIKTLIADYNKGQTRADPEIFRKFANIKYALSRYLTEWNCATGEIYHRMIPLFEKTLANKNITAWVMANDYSAMLAIDYLKEKKVPVPEALSIISFDNTPDAVEYQLTSYDFNHSGAISLMLNYAIRPSIIPKPQRGKIIELEGTIIERRSTARNSRLK
jgi:DNA-binding LacI/PurR family transcriptional regulator/DNA-binding transcriptional regulator YhcF (GntR family)